LLLPPGSFPPTSPRKERGTFGGTSLLEAARRLWVRRIDSHLRGIDAFAGT